MFRILLFCVILRASHKVSSQAVDPPIMRVGSSPEIKGMESKYSVSIRKYPRVIQPMVPATPSEEKTTTTEKRDADLIDRITTLSTYDENLLEPEEDLSPKNCAFTFTLPNPLPTSQEVCVTEVGNMPTPNGDYYNEYDNTVEVTEIRDQVSTMQETMLEMKNQIAELLSGADLEPLKSDIRLLQKENVKVNSRLSQLYIQFLNEIIRARDDTIDFSRLENSVLNITVKYHELKERHEDLVSQHNLLNHKSDAQQTEINYLQKRMEEVNDQVNKAALRAEQAWTWCKQLATSGNEDGDLTNITIPPLIKADFRDCSDVARAGFRSSGKYDIQVLSLDRKVRVWCDFDQDPGGWTVIQRRSVGRINFYRNMASYQRGFGSLESDFWLGLEVIHHLTSQTDRNYKLHIDMEDWNGITTFVEYGSFRIEGQDDGYRLRIAHYSGTAGDSLTWHNNMKFSTKNVDNDPFKRNCAHYHKGGWWYKTCAHSNLNGIYYKTGIYTGALHSAQDGIFWSAWRRESYSLKRVEMKIMSTE